MVFLEVFLFHTVLQGFVRFVAQVGLAAFTLFTSAPAWVDAQAQEAGYQNASAPAAQPALKPFLFQPAEGATGIQIPRQERLVYQAYLDVALVSANVGTVTQTCTVQELQPLLMVARPSVTGDAASIKLEAKGGYLWYELESTLETSILPQDWPHLKYTQMSKTKSTTRRREVWLGSKDGEPASRYQGDTSKGAPDGTRIWRPATERTVPKGTFDMLTAVFMARTLIREGKETLTFPLLDKDRIWNLTLRRGDEERMETAAGTFDLLEVLLVPSPYPGEPLSEKAKQFEGVFGIHGSIHLWVDKKTGIAVRIQGDLPVDDGLITLGIDVKLKSYSGTPPEFAPVP